MTDRELMQDALDVIIAAIKSGDWKVDGACDPDFVINALRARLATCDRCGKVNPAELHTCTPPQREWVGLTEQEHTELAIECGCLSADWVFYGAAVERKLKDKNGG